MIRILRFLSLEAIANNMWVPVYVPISGVAEDKQLRLPGLNMVETFLS